MHHQQAHSFDLSAGEGRAPIRFKTRSNGIGDISAGGVESVSSIQTFPMMPQSSSRNNLSRSPLPDQQLQHQRYSSYLDQPDHSFGAGGTVSGNGSFGDRDLYRYNRAQERSHSTLQHNKLSDPTNVLSEYLDSHYNMLGGNTHSRQPRLSEEYRTQSMLTTQGAKNSSKLSEHVTNFLNVPTIKTSTKSPARGSKQQMGAGLTRTKSTTSTAKSIRVKKHQTQSVNAGRGCIMPKQRIQKATFAINRKMPQPQQARANKSSRSCENLGAIAKAYGSSNSNQRKLLTSKSGTRIRKQESSQQTSYFPPLTQSIRDFVEPNSIMSNVESGKMKRGPKSNKSSGSRMSKNGILVGNLANTIKRSPSVTKSSKKMLRRSTTQKSLRSQSALRNISDPQARGLELETRSVRKSARAGCSDSKSVKSRKGSTSTGGRSVKSTGGPKVAKIGKLRERHAMLKRHIQKVNEGDASRADLATIEARPEPLHEVGALFQTSNFNDQNYTATFQGSRKEAQIGTARSSTSADKRIVNIMTNSHQRYVKRSNLSNNMRTRSTSSLASAGKSRVKSGNRTGKSATSQLSLENSLTRPKAHSRSSTPFEKYAINEPEMTMHQSSIAQTNSQQYLNNYNMHGSSMQRFEPAEHSRQFQSRISQNTLGQTHSAHASPSITQMPTTLVTAEAQPVYHHGLSVGFSDHAASASLISTKDNNILVQRDVQPQFVAPQVNKQPGIALRVKLGRLPQLQENAHAKSMTQLQIHSTKSYRNQDCSSVGSTNAPKSGQWTQRQSQEVTPTSNLTAREISQKPSDIIGLERSWNEALDQMENMAKARVSSLRSRLTRIIKQNKMNLTIEGANDQFEQVMMAKSPTERGVNELIKLGLNSDQERVISQMQAELASKDKLRSDYQRLRHKYTQRRDDWAKQLRTLDARASEEKNQMAVELQSQVSYYRGQVDDLGRQMRQEIMRKTEECENAINGGQGYKDALLQTRSDVDKMQDQVVNLNLMLQRSEAEIDRYRSQLEQVRERALDQEVVLQRDAEQKVKETKVLQKEKAKRQIEQIEAINKNNLILKVQEARDISQELHKKDLEIAEEKFELRVRTNFIEIDSHENIVRQLQLREREQNKSIFDEALLKKDAQIAQVANEIRDQAEKENQRLLENNELLRNDLTNEQNMAREALEEKEHQWSQLLEARTAQAILEMQEAVQKTSELTQALSEIESEKKELEALVASLQAEHSQKTMQFSSNEDNMMRDIDQLGAKLEEQFKVSEELVLSQNKVRELKDALKLQKQENSSLDSMIKTKEAAIERVVKDSHHLKKRISWITQLKQTQIRQLKSDLDHLRNQLSSDLQTLQGKFAAQTGPIVRLATQLSQHLAEKETQLESMSTKFENILQQLEQATKIKDAQALELLGCTKQRDQLKLKLEKMTKQLSSEAQCQKNENAKNEKDRSKVDSDLAESKTRANRLEDRVYNLNKMVENMSAQIKQSSAQVNQVKEERQADLKEHERAMGDKEKKLQEVFCTKLDRKITKLSAEHKKVLDELAQSHEQQTILFEQEFSVAQGRIVELENRAIVTESRQQQQRQRTREREAQIKRQRQTQKIEQEVSQSIEKALGRSASRRNGTKVMQHMPQQRQMQQQQPHHDPYMLQANGYQPQLLRSQGNNEDSPSRNNVYGTLSRAATHHQIVSPNQTGLGLSIHDLQQQQQYPVNSTASFVLGGGIGPNQAAYRYDIARSSSSLNTRAMIRSKSTMSGGHVQLAKNVENGSADLERENYPPSFSQVVNKANKDQRGYVRDQQQTVSSHDGAVFNPLLTIKPSQQVSYQQQNTYANGGGSSEPIGAHEAVSNANMSRDAISRSFEAKLLQSTDGDIAHKQ